MVLRAGLRMPHCLLVMRRSGGDQRQSRIWVGMPPYGSSDDREFCIEPMDLDHLLIDNDSLGLASWKENRIRPSDRFERDFPERQVWTAQPPSPPLQTWSPEIPRLLRNDYNISRPDHSIGGCCLLLHLCAIILIYSFYKKHLSIFCSLLHYLYYFFLVQKKAMALNSRPEDSKKWKISVPRWTTSTSETSATRTLTPTTTAKCL